VKCINILKKICIKIRKKISSNLIFYTQPITLIKEVDPSEDDLYEIGTNWINTKDHRIFINKMNLKNKAKWFKIQGK